MIVILWVLLGLNLAECAMLAVLFSRWYLRRRAKRADEQAEREMQRQPDPMDEGFENIMRFAVNGKTGFD